MAVRGLETWDNRPFNDQLQSAPSQSESIQGI